MRKGKYDYKYEKKENNALYKNMNSKEMKYKNDVINSPDIISK